MWGLSGTTVWQDIDGSNVLIADCGLSRKLTVHQMRVNARLVAAAPMLAQALRDLVGSPTDADCLKRAQDVLSKL